LNDFFLICLANVDCPYGTVKCGGDSFRPPCINSHELCDGIDHCRDGWDENIETCGWFNNIDLSDWFVLINIIGWLFQSDFSSCPSCCRWDGER